MLITEHLALAYICERLQKHLKNFGLETIKEAELVDLIKIEVTLLYRFLQESEDNL